MSSSGGTNLNGLAELERESKLCELKKKKKQTKHAYTYAQMLWENGDISEIRENSCLVLSALSSRIKSSP